MDGTSAPFFDKAQTSPTVDTHHPRPCRATLTVTHGPREVVPRDVSSYSRFKLDGKRWSWHDSVTGRTDDSDGLNNVRLKEGGEIQHICSL